MALLNSILLQMLQKKIKIFSIVLSHGASTNLFKKCALLAMIKTLVTITYKTWVLLKGTKCFFATEHLIEKPNRKLALRIIRNKESFLLLHILELFETIMR